MTIEKAILSAKEPKETNTAWVQPKGDSLQLNIFNNGKWRPIAGGGNSTTVTNKYPVDPNAPMLSMDNVYAQMNLIAERLGISSGEPTQEQTEYVMNELKSYKFATPKQGNAVLLDYDLENNTFTFQCDDGSIITFNSDHGEDVITGLRPDIDGYLIWKTTRDKLPVRESQEETDPDKPNPGDVKDTKSVKSVKSGLLGDVLPPDPSTEEVYTVINNNTGEIVDPLELHKLTNVIWYGYYSIYYPFYLNGATDINNLPPVFQSMDLNQIQISVWVRTNYSPSTFSYLGVSLYYDYTLEPNTMSRINTTANSDVSDINAFFNY